MQNRNVNESDPFFEGTGEQTCSIVRKEIGTIDGSKRPSPADWLDKDVRNPAY